MYAIVRNGGRQFTAREGEVLELERIADKKPGDTVDFTDILLVSKSEGDVRVGAPLVAGVTVRGKILKEFRGEKIDIIKYRRREDSQTKKGHRQTLIKVKIEKING
ncbi:MAG: 50S ribosomal protein L21 [Planctomycetota bacterium]